MNRLSEAKVKAVQSGDTLILQNVRNPGQERTLSLAFVSAPRLRREGDEVSYPFPFLSPTYFFLFRQLYYIVRLHTCRF